MTWAPTDSSGKTDELDSVRSSSPLAPSSSPLDDLQSVAPMILNVELRDRGLARYDGPKRLVAGEVLQSTAQLVQITEWSGEQLLTNLGCPLRTHGDLAAVDIKRLTRCQTFLRFLSRLTGLVDVVPDRRAVVIECAGLLKTTGRDADGLVELVESGDFTPVDYIRLGEIGAAAELARTIAAQGATPVQDMATTGPFGEAPIVHLSTARIEMYIADMHDALGNEVSQRIKAHLERCEACAEAVAYCRAHAAVPEGVDLPLPAELARPTPTPR